MTKTFLQFCERACPPHDISIDHRSIFLPFVDHVSDLLVKTNLLDGFCCWSIFLETCLCFRLAVFEVTAKYIGLRDDGAEPYILDLKCPSIFCQLGKAINMLYDFHVGCGSHF